MRLSETFRGKRRRDQQTVALQAATHSVLAIPDNWLQAARQSWHGMPCDAPTPDFSMAAGLTLRMTGGD
jgi:hypothetical protein